MHYILMLDLKNDPNLIAAYEEHHRAVWPEVLAHLQQNGVAQMEIWRLGTRLVMVLTPGEGFSFERLAASAENNEAVQRWEELMWRFQEATPWTDEGGKWQPMTPIFDFQAALNTP
ncbi:L-rhamnose mutarotase [Neisseria sp. HSC-16F19]|nr:L-rhamnose mutarotase [Neisseria sp. HSC-16F19]MCP2039872.1 L-rhamnose mutarotase [Neisseria sp. HSC-16F19]